MKIIMNRKMPNMLILSDYCVCINIVFEHNLSQWCRLIHFHILIYMMNAGVWWRNHCTKASAIGEVQFVEESRRVLDRTQLTTATALLGAGVGFAISKIWLVHIWGTPRSSWVRSRHICHRLGLLLNWMVGNVCSEAWLVHSWWPQRASGQAKWPMP